MNEGVLTAKNAGLLACHGCDLLSAPPAGDGAAGLRCPRCGAALHRRKPNSLARTWALLMAAAILYIPANLIPITRAVALGKAQEDTILSGVLYFIKTGAWPIALVIFTASIFFPLLKLVILSFLLISVDRGWHFRRLDRTRLYRLTEVVGRWSMVDVFVVTILVALVKLGAFATMEARPGAVYFAAVVVLTMFAAESFDPRLIWDMEETHGQA